MWSPRNYLDSNTLFGNIELLISEAIKIIITHKFTEPIQVFLAL